MTGNVLRKQNTGDAAGSAELRARRDEVLRWLQRFDAELFQAIVAAEGRLGQLLAQYMTGSSPSAEDVVQAAGSKPLEVFAFWLVVRSAAAAWRLKLGIDSVAQLAEQKLQELSEVAEAIEPEPEAQLRLLRAAGCVACACQRHAFEAYNP